MYMIKSLFINTTILISFITVGSQFFKDAPLNGKTILKKRIATALGCGILGCILMIFGIQVTDTSTILDLRHIAIIIIVYLTGFYPSLMTTLVICIFRLTHFGVTTSSLVAVISVISITLGCNVIKELMEEGWKQWLWMNIYSIIVVTLNLNVFTSKTSDYLLRIFLFLIVSIFVGIMTYNLLKYVIESNKLFRKLRIQAKKDFLTGLNNVREFDISLNGMMENSKTNRGILTHIILDIDNFKQVNDTYGHPAGDSILQQLSNVLRESCQYDKPVYRVGGEEFSILLQDNSLKEGIELAEKIRKNVEKFNFVIPDGTRIQITVSLGVASYPETASSKDRLIKQADEGLYKAKHSGKNSVGVIE
ncbi:GGDEF domain-containing protein [Sporosalibacterium faouarense]|uniref:GGDEF domain-containing protein n=1 Tax=Sporosalibacterium faouarense TaxID=516123 RepID=UPI00141CD5AB|nr:GGDEF domain-containing protein [Sporosalibacterium faouarense]MTI47472.1 diguanylate cyclase [Bacillota bacterium]